MNYIPTCSNLELLYRCNMLYIGLILTQSQKDITFDDYVAGNDSK